MTASIIVRCYNEEKHIGKLLERLFKQTVPDLEVIIVDSGSTDKTLSIASQFSVQIVQICKDEFTFGFSLNQGCQAATGDYLVILSAHVVPTSNDFVEKLIKPFEDPKVALTYGKQVGTTTTKFSEHELFEKYFPGISDFSKKDPFCNNACAAIRRDLWIKQKYDETLTGLEDMAWGKWAIQNDYYIAYTADAEIIHIHDENASSILNRYKREAIALKEIFPDTGMKFVAFLSLLLSNVTLDILRAIKQRKFMSNIKDILVFRFMQYLGTYRGLNYRSPVTHEMIVQLFYPRTPDRLLRYKSRNTAAFEKKDKQLGES